MLKNYRTNVVAMQFCLINNPTIKLCLLSNTVLSGLVILFEFEFRMGTYICVGT